MNLCDKSMVFSLPWHESCYYLFRILHLHKNYEEMLLSLFPVRALYLEQCYNSTGKLKAQVTEAFLLGPRLLNLRNY